MLLQVQSTEQQRQLGRRSWSRRTEDASCTSKSRTIFSTRSFFRDIMGGLSAKTFFNPQVVNSIKNWQKDNYHKQMMQLKEKKEMEDQFKKAQKPWAKLLEKVDKCKVREILTSS